MSERDQHDSDLSAQDVALIGRLLIPTFKEALREEFNKVRQDFTDALSASNAATRLHINELEKRVKALETAKNRALMAWGGIVAFITVTYQVTNEWVKQRIGWK